MLTCYSATETWRLFRTAEPMSSLAAQMTQEEGKRFLLRRLPALRLILYLLDCTTLSALSAASEALPGVPTLACKRARPSQLLEQLMPVSSFPGLNLSNGNKISMPGSFIK